MIKNFEQLKEMLKAMPVKRKVAVVPAQDEHTLESISHAYRDGMVEPVLIGDEPKIREILAQIGTDADKMTIIHVEDPTEAIQKAADMARDGEVDCIMKGKTETGALMKVLVNRERGIRKRQNALLDKIQISFGKVSSALTQWKERLRDIRRKPGSHSHDGDNDKADRGTAESYGRDDTGIAGTGSTAPVFPGAEPEFKKLKQRIIRAAESFARYRRTALTDRATENQNRTVGKRESAAETKIKTKRQRM